ncbi:MAG: type VI secretion system tip protein VgrG [Flavobacteriales bacterium]|nr:type VI secretion system tip protein VgrG [Flavobacteriales bacterium]
MSRKVDCTVLINGNKLEQVAHISVVQRMDWHHTFEVRLPLKDAKLETFKEQAEKDLGKKAVIRINFAPERPDSHDFSFKGVVTNAAFNRSQGGTPEIALSGSSVTCLLDDASINRSFTEKSLDKIVEEVCQDSKSKPVDFALEVQAAYQASLPFTVQYEESNFHFLGRLAARYGEWFFFDGEKLHFGKPGSQHEESLMFGGNLFSFDIGLQMERKAFEIRHYDHVKSESLKANEDSGKKTGLEGDALGKIPLKESDALLAEQSLVMIGAAPDQADLDQRAMGMKAASATRSVVLRGVSDNTRLAVGKKVKVQGPKTEMEKGGTLDYGTFIITSISHSSGNGNYQNQFEAIPADAAMIPMLSGLRQAVCDPQVAKVTDVDDPEKLGRVKVQFLWQLGTSETSPWIRVIQPHANDGFGAYVVPETGEEVMVDFEFNDPEQPFVVGSVYHGKAKPDPAWATPKNETRAFRTKSGNEIIVIDKAGKESIQVRNKDGKNELVMTLGGEPTLTVKTDGKLTLEAKTIVMKCQELDIDAKAGAKLKSSGTVEIKSDSQLKAGAAQVSIDGTAMTEVKGGIVKIN